MKISIICSESNHPVNSWIHTWANNISERHEINIVTKSNQLTTGNILFLVSCHEIIDKETRENFDYTLVLHASNLPYGRGMSPHIWQIVEGKNRILLTLLDAEDKLDSGKIWKQKEIFFDGSELFDEINNKIFSSEIELMSWAIKNIYTSSPFEQVGEPTFYRKRTPEDSRIDIKKTIDEQFNLLRVADPERYPAFFERNGHTYKIKIEKIIK